MDPTILYIACLLGSLGLYLLLRPAGVANKARTRSIRMLGAVIAFAAIAWLLVQCAEAVGAAAGRGRPEVFFSIFGLIALVSAPHG